MLCPIYWSMDYRKASQEFSRINGDLFRSGRPVLRSLNSTIIKCNGPSASPRWADIQLTVDYWSVSHRKMNRLLLLQITHPSTEEIWTMAKLQVTRTREVPARPARRLLTSFEMLTEWDRARRE